MTRADDDPEQANADLARHNDAVSRADAAVDAANAREEALVEQIDVAYEAGDTAEVESLKALHAQAEIDLDNARNDLESETYSLNSAYKFWYEEDEDEDDEDE